jgi:hypothetical protein
MHLDYYFTYKQRTQFKKKENKGCLEKYLEDFPKTFLEYLGQQLRLESVREREGEWGRKFLYVFGQNLTM